MLSIANDIEIFFFTKHYNSIAIENILLIPAFLTSLEVRACIHYAAYIEVGSDSDNLAMTGISTTDARNFNTSSFFTAARTLRCNRFNVRKADGFI